MIKLAEVLTIIGGVLVCGGFWTFIQFIISRWDKKKEQKADKTSKIDKTTTEMQKAIKDLSKAVTLLQQSVDHNNEDMALQNEALMSIAQDRIVWLARQYIKQGWIYDEDLTSMRRMADAYKALGGNALVKTEMDIVDKLETRAR